MIVATEPGELGRVDELERRGKANGVPGLRRIDAQGIEALEPHARGIAGLHSPSTGIVDFPAVARAYAEDVLEAGGAVVTGCAVEGVREQGAALQLLHSHGATEAGHAIFCAGAWADRLAVAAGADPDPRIVPFRGAYLRLVPERRGLVRSLIYPVPDPVLPFLGVHLTKHIDGDVLIGPTALLAGARDAYALGRVRGEDLRETLVWPGSWRMFRSWWRTGLTELRHAALRSAFVRAAARYVPELRPEDVEPAFAGVRAQALGRDGRLGGRLRVLGDPAGAACAQCAVAGATSSLAIGRYVVGEAERGFGLES